MCKVSVGVVLMLSDQKQGDTLPLKLRGKALVRKTIDFPALPPIGTHVVISIGNLVGAISFDVVGYAYTAYDETFIMHCKEISLPYFANEANFIASGWEVE